MIALMVTDFEKNLDLKYVIKISTLKVNVTKVEDNYAIFVTFSRIEEPLKKSWFFNIPTYLKNNEKLEEVCNLFTTSDPPKYSNSNSPYLCFCLLKGGKKSFLLVENIFWTNENVFLFPFNKQKHCFKQRSDKFL